MSGHTKVISHFTITGKDENQKSVRRTFYMKCRIFKKGQLLHGQQNVNYKITLFVVY